jgi:hypothetical protein
MQKGAFAIELLCFLCFKNCLVCVLFLCQGFVNLFMVHILLTYYVIIVSFISESSWKLAFFGGLEMSRRVLGSKLPCFIGDNKLTDLYWTCH